MGVTRAVATAESRAEARAEARDRTEARAINAAIRSLHNHATDCLRLSMHYFHPIQQCAQHMYHTALPLSPTFSHLHKSCLQRVITNNLSHVVAFLGAPTTWGSLLRTIDVRPRQLTYTMTSAQRIIAACGDIVNIYDAITGVLQQFIHAPETVLRMQGSPDGSILFFAHLFSVGIWDVQTGGLIDTFTVESEISSIAASTTHVACGSSDGSIIFWNLCTKKESRGSWDGKPIVTIYWLSPQELAVVTQSTICIWDIIINETIGRFTIPGYMWGIVYLENEKEFLVGVSQPNQGMGQESFFIRCKQPKLQSQDQGLLCWKFAKCNQSPVHSGQLSNPTIVGDEITCLNSVGELQLFNLVSCEWTKNPLHLGIATSVVLPLNGNIVAQTNDSIQIFSIDGLRSSRAHNKVHTSHIYPLGKKYIICLQSTRHLTLLRLETLQELEPNDNTPPYQSSLTSPLPFDHAPPLVNQSPFACASLDHGLVVEFDALLVMQAWQSGTPLPERTETVGEDAQLCGWSPGCTCIITVHGSTKQELHVTDVKDGTPLAFLPLEDDELGMGEVYNITFDSEAIFHLKIDGPGQHIQHPYNIIASPSGHYSHTITKGQPVPLSKPRETPPYRLDANCEWVLDSKSRKICWISPGDVRRGSGGHFWSGPSLVMVGDDGVVRKLTFKDPDS